MSKKQINPDCIFCKIVEGEIPSVKIWEDEDFLAFLDINPVNEGHSLIVPKWHYEKMENCPKRLISKIFVKTQNLMEVIKESLKADYVAISVVGLDVPHFHIHIIPRYFNDRMSNFWPTKKYKSEKQMEEIANKIKQNLKNDKHNLQ